MSVSKKASSNLRKIFFIRALRSGMFSIAVIVLFFKECGLSMSEVIILQAAFAFGVIIFELPTGYYADNYGRKKSIVIGGCFSTLGFAAYALSSTFSGFFLGEILLAIGSSFISGADSAIIYDCVNDRDGCGALIKAEGNSIGFAMFSEALTSFIGGSFLALVSLRFPLYFDILLSFPIILIGLTLEETGKFEVRKQEGAAKIVIRIVRIMKDSVRDMVRLMKYSLHDHVEIKWLIFYSAVAGTSTLTMVWFIPVYFVSVGIKTQWFGALWAAFILIGAWVSMNAHMIEKKLGRKLSLVALIVFPVIAYFLLDIYATAWSVAFISFFYVTRGMNNPIVKSYINGLISLEERATILSVQSLMGRAMFIVVGPVMGWICDEYSIGAVMTACGVLFGLLGIVALLFMHRNRVL